LPQLISTLFLNKKTIGTKDDVIQLVTKQADGTKQIDYIEKPIRTYYLLKPEYDDGSVKPSVPLDQVDKVTCYERSKINDIVKRINDPDLTIRYQNILQQGQYDRSAYSNLKYIEKDRRVFDSDGNIVDQYIRTFNKKFDFKKNLFSLTKGYFDIEVDGSQITGFPREEDALAPVNIITFFDSNTNDCYTYTLKYQTENYRDVMKDDAKEVKEALNKIYEGLGYKFHIYQYDTEMEVIKAFFNQVNESSRDDFMLG